MSFEVQLPLFQGPFDLLLFFIERDELDIYDIPISRLTQDFLDYLHHLEQLNIEVAGEFILVAATLMRIKSRSMLPRPEVNDQGQEIDPRQELVQQLLEYKKYKSVVAELAALELSRSMQYERGNVAKELKVLAKASGTDYELQDVDLFRLLKVYQKVMKQYEEEQSRPRHTVVTFPYTVEEQKAHIKTRIANDTRVGFVELLKESGSKIKAIFDFLAILELLALQEIGILIGEGYNNFWLVKPGETPVAEEAAPVVPA
jgi:segregation and condensation protein A